MNSDHVVQDVGEFRTCTRTIAIEGTHLSPVPVTQLTCAIYVY